MLRESIDFDPSDTSDSLYSFILDRSGVLIRARKDYGGADTAHTIMMIGGREDLSEIADKMVKLMDRMQSENEKLQQVIERLMKDKKGRKIFYK
jgi:hypothetical protein